MTLSQTTLHNGLRVMLAPMEHNATVTVLLLTAAGSKYERKEQNGISHFLEHMCFKGTTKRPSAEIISKELDRIGGEFNAFTSKEYTGYYAKVRAAHAPIALDVVSDIFVHQLIAQEEVERERNVIIEEINMYRDTPTDHIGDVWEELLYGDQPAGWPVAGTADIVRGMSRADMVAYHREHYTAENSLVIIAGDEAALKRCEKELPALFAKLHTSHAKGKPHVQEQQKVPGVKLEYKDTDQVHLALGVRSINLFDPRRYTVAVMSAILGGGMSSRLFLNVRERQGLGYYIKTSPEQYTDSGYICTFAGIQKTRVEDAVKSIIGEYKRIAVESVEEEELHKARELLKGRLALRLEGSDDIALFWGAQELLTKHVLAPEDIFRRIDEVNATDIRRVAGEFFVPSRLNLAILGPLKDPEPFTKLLTQL